MKYTIRKNEKGELVVVTQPTSMNNFTQKPIEETYDPNKGKTNMVNYLNKKFEEGPVNQYLSKSKAVEYMGAPLEGVVMSLLSDKKLSQYQPTWITPERYGTPKDIAKSMGENTLEMGSLATAAMQPATAAQSVAYSDAAQIVNNIKNKRPLSEGLGEASKRGVETSAVLVVTNAATDKALTSIASKFSPQISRSITGLVGSNTQLPFKYSKVATDQLMKNKLFKEGVKRVIARAIVEVPAESTAFGTIKAIKNKENVVKSIAREIPDSLAGNLLFAGANIGFKGADVYLGDTFKQIGQVVKNNLKNIGANEKGFIVPGALVGSEYKTVQSPDNVYKKEIPDYQAKMPKDVFKKYNEIVRTDSTVKLNDILEHDELYKAIPELKNVNVVVMDSGLKLDTNYNPDSNTIYLKKDIKNKEIEQDILHEVQHAIQDKFPEFAKGGSPDQMGKLVSSMDNARKVEKMKALLELERTKEGTPEYKSLKEKIVKLSYVKDIPTEKSYQKYAAYMNLLGEIEARAVASRRSMNPTQLSEIDPYAQEMGRLYTNKNNVITYYGGSKNPILNPPTENITKQQDDIKSFTKRPFISDTTKNGMEYPYKDYKRYSTEELTEMIKKGILNYDNNSNLLVTKENGTAIGRLPKDVIDKLKYDGFIPDKKIDTNLINQMNKSVKGDDIVDGFIRFNENEPEYNVNEQFKRFAEINPPKNATEQNRLMKQAQDIVRKNAETGIATEIYRDIEGAYSKQMREGAMQDGRFVRSDRSENIDNTLEIIDGIKSKYGSIYEKTRKADLEWNFKKLTGKDVKYEDLPEKIKIFRGGNVNEAGSDIFTLDEKVASKFGKVNVFEINKSDVPIIHNNPFLSEYEMTLRVDDVKPLKTK